MTDELWSWTASELAMAIRSGRISSVAATTSALARMEAVNPAINAVVDPLPDDALEAAHAADKALSQGVQPGPLHGVPVTVKINVDYAGRATTNGVRAYANLIAPEDGSVVRNLRGAGAVMIGRTNTPCYSMRWFTENALHGATLNPHDPAITPGGSSGGAGAATAAGIGAIGHGNDIGGSVRYPAYCCGLFGLRPTSGLLPAYNPSQMAERMIASQMMAVQGPLARSVQDIRLAMAALSAPDPRDIWQVPMPPSDASFRPCRVALMATPPDCDSDPEVIAAIHEAAAILTTAGYSVEEVPTPSIEEAADLWRLIMVNEMRVGLGRLIAENGDPEIQYAYAAIEQGVPDLDRDGFLKALAQRSRLLRDWQLLFASHPLVLTAVAWKKPYPVGHDQTNAAQFDSYYREVGPTTMAPILGLPGISVPVRSGPGLPLGVQLLSARFGENALLAAAEVIERANGPLLPVTPGRAVG
ncbi:amidase [Pararhodobacter sp.]|uniref:amidase n=1 Tax=Pararhodobacter sp. TaxID=2127056 RepID=UPI002FDCB587